MNVTKQLEYVLFPLAEKIDRQRHVSAMKEGLSATIPLTIVGGFALVLSCPPIDPKTMTNTDFFSSFLLAWHVWATANANILSIPYTLTLGLLSVYAVCTISASLASKYNLNSIISAVSSLVVFLAVSAMPVAIDGHNILPMKNLDASGLFTAIIVALITVEVSRFLTAKKFSIKLPDSVPPMVSAPFEALIPIVVNIILFISLNGILGVTLHSDLPSLLVNLLKPLLSASDSLLGVISLNFLCDLLWFFGIHGHNVTTPLIQPITLINVGENATAATAGLPLPKVLAGNFLTVFGSFCVYPSLLVSILLIAKSAKLRSLGKVATTPDIFNINEPLVFGVPIVMNVMLIIPILFLGQMNIIIAYIVMSLGLVQKFYILAPWTTPGPINAFLSTMDWKAAVLWFAIFALDVIIWLPFLKGYDKKFLNEEKSTMCEENNVTLNS